MTVETLRQAIAARARELLPERLEHYGIVYHKKGWKCCPCTWCTKKREATTVIGMTRGWRNGICYGVVIDGREPVRRRYRKELSELEEDGTELVVDEFTKKIEKFLDRCK